MAAISGLGITTPKILGKASEYSSNSRYPINIKVSWRRCRKHVVRVVPDKLSEKVEESIKNAQEACSEDPISGECKAAWDEVEELSAAVSHAKVKQKESDPLENYCKDNPETDECRTYDN